MITFLELMATAITRKELYSLVWSATMSKIGSQLNVRATDITKVCVAHNIPKPPSGYWSQLKFNKQPSIPPLEGLDDTIDLSQWIIKPRSIAVSADGSVSPRPFKPKKEEHPLIDEIRQYLKNDTPWGNRKHHIGIYVSKGLQKRAFRIINEVLLRAIDHGFTINSKENQTRIEKDGHYRTISLREGYSRVKKENPSIWDTEIKVPNGVLYLKIGEGYRSKQFSDKKRVSIEQQIDEILIKLAADIDEDNERTRIYEEQRQQKLEAYLELKKKQEVINNELDRFREMMSQVERFQKIKRMREYLVVLHQKTQKTEEDVKWTEWCESAIDWYDPTIMKSHPILDFAKRSTLSVKTLDRELEQWGSYSKDLTWDCPY